MRPQERLVPRCHGGLPPLREGDPAGSFRIDCGKFVRVTLASRILGDVCEGLNLGFGDPESMRLEEGMDRENEGFLSVPKAGETFYRLHS